MLYIKLNIKICIVVFEHFLFICIFFVLFLFVVRCCDYALCRCLRRVPYATLFAFLLLAGGLALMTYEIIMIRETADDLFEGTVMYAEHSGYKKG